MLKEFSFKSASDLKKRRFPDDIRTFSSMHNMHALTEQLVLSGFEPDAPFITKDMPIVSLGSCFATHIAEYLSKRGLDVSHHFFSERLFTTHALRYFIDCIQQGVMPESLFSNDSDIITREMMQAMQTKLLKGCTTVITLGMAMIWTHKTSGQRYFDMPKTAPSQFDEYEMRHTPVEENAENLRQIIHSIKALNPDNRIVLTVSPVPLLFSKSDYPVMAADFLSKSRLRLAVDELTPDNIPGVHYYPSFEMVRWAAPFSVKVWGVGDNDARHIDPEFTAFIMQIFEQHYCSGLGAIPARKVMAEEIA